MKKIFLVNVFLITSVSVFIAGSNEVSAQCAAGSPCTIVGDRCCAGGILYECKAIICSNNSECDDSNPCTSDTCVNPGLSTSSCSHTVLSGNDCGDCMACNTNGNCVSTCSSPNICEATTDFCALPLTVSVSSTPSGSFGITWTANVSGGTGIYSYSWSGTDNLSGTTSSVTKNYLTEGNKNATVTVTSGSQVASSSGSYNLVFPNSFPAGTLYKSFFVFLGTCNPTTLLSLCWPTGTDSDSYGNGCSATNPAVCYPASCSECYCPPCWVFPPSGTGYYACSNCTCPPCGDATRCETGCTYTQLTNLNSTNLGYFRRTLICPVGFTLQLSSCSGTPCPSWDAQICATPNRSCSYNCVRQ